MVGDIAHVFNRGVEKRKVFLDNQDYLRFIESLYLLNNKKGKIRIRSSVLNGNIKPPKQEKLVEILKWVIMPNHYHLLVQEIEEGGIVEFTKRLGNSYTKYFNTRYKGRSGYLFQNKAQIKTVIEERHFLYLPYYIDLNPMNIGMKGNVIDFLKNYKWSNFNTFYKANPFSVITDSNRFYGLFNTDQRKYEKELLSVSTWQVDTLEEMVS